VIVVTNGQAAPVGGLFLDQHGHRLYLRRGQIVPLCPQYGPFSVVQWRLCRLLDG
jgi:hypothetical protein